MVAVSDMNNIILLCRLILLRCSTFAITTAVLCIFSSQHHASSCCHPRSIGGRACLYGDMGARHTTTVGGTACNCMGTYPGRAEDATFCTRILLGCGIRGDRSRSQKLSQVAGLLRRPFRQQRLLRLVSERSLSTRLDKAVLRARP